MCMHSGPLPLCIHLVKHDLKHPHSQALRSFSQGNSVTAVTPQHVPHLVQGNCPVDRRGTAIALSHRSGLPGHSSHPVGACGQCQWRCRWWAFLEEGRGGEGGETTGRRLRELERWHLSHQRLSDRTSVLKHLYCFLHILEKEALSLIWRWENEAIRLTPSNLHSSRFLKA